MTFEEAFRKLEEIAGENTYCSIDYQKTKYKDGDFTAGISCYIELIGWTKVYPTFNEALSEMRLKKEQKEIKQDLDPQIDDGQ